MKSLVSKKASALINAFQISFLSVFVSVYSIASQAQEADSRNAIEEIVVTAQMREARLQDVPLSVAVLTEQQLARQGALNFEDYGRSVPAVSFIESGRHARGGLEPAIRGIFLGGESTTTAFYIDDTPLHPSKRRLGIIDPNMFDINRIEVLRGPQGDLYGSSAMGGAIRVITNKPDPANFDMSVAGNAGTLSAGGEKFDVNAMLNIPLAEDRAALRLVGLYAKEDGFIDSIPFEDFDLVENLPNVTRAHLASTLAREDRNSVETVGARAAIRWNATDRLTITPSYYGQTARADRVRFVSGLLTESAGEPVDVDFGFDEPVENNFSILNLHMEYDIDWATITSSSTLYEVERSGIFGATGIISGVFGETLPTFIGDVEKEEQTVQEIRLSTALDGPFQYLVGMFYRKSEYGLDQLMYNEELTPVLGSPLLFSRDGEDSWLKERAIFGRVTWSISESWELEPGVRWAEYDRLTFIPETQGPFGYATLTNPASESAVSPSLTLTYRDRDSDFMTYARAASAYRPGYAQTINFPSPCDPYLAELGLGSGEQVLFITSDALWNYELGVRTSLFDGSLSGSLTAFYIDWDDIQITRSLPCGFAISANAGVATSRGIELQIQSNPSDDLSLSLGVGYVDAKLAGDAPALGGEEGDRLPQIPQWTIAASAQQYLPAFSRPTYIRADYSYAGSSHYDFSFSPSVYRSPVGLLNLRFAVELDRWEIGLFARNVLDLQRTDLCSPDNFRHLSPDYGTCVNEPRHVGLSVRWSMR